MFFKFANQSDIIRAEQKDEFYLNYFFEISRGCWSFFLGLNMFFIQDKKESLI
jgi:hypothetical protein